MIYFLSLNSQTKSLLPLCLVMMDTEGWLNYFAVLPKYQKSGFGKQLLKFGEKTLVDRGCPKINLQIRADNKEAINFYNAVGYDEDEVISYGKRLIED